MSDWDFGDRDSVFRRFAADRSTEQWLLDYTFRLSFGKPQMLLKNVIDTDPKKAMAALKRDDPDGYANLTEHLDVPKEWLP